MSFDEWAITLAVFLPAVGAVAVALMPRDRDRLVRGLGILFTAVPLAIGAAMLFGFDFAAPGAFGTAEARDALQFSVDLRWISVRRCRAFSSSGAAFTSSSSCLIMLPIRMTLAGCSIRREGSSSSPDRPPSASDESTCIVPTGRPSGPTTTTVVDSRAGASACGVSLMSWILRT